MINAARTAITASLASVTDTSYRQTAAKAANCLYQIETQVNLNKNDSIINSFNTYAATLKLNSLANSILQSYNNMQTQKSSWKKWTPVIQLNSQNILVIVIDCACNFYCIFFRLIYFLMVSVCK